VELPPPLPCLHPRHHHLPKIWAQKEIPPLTPSIDVSYAALQAHEIVNVALHQEYSPGILFIFS
jgi:hypothetical protein